jgi:hypothetical protein
MSLKGLVQGLWGKSTVRFQVVAWGLAIAALGAWEYNSRQQQLKSNKIEAFSEAERLEWNKRAITSKGKRME